MGKYRRKSKNFTDIDISVDKISEISSIGVRTRAKTLALQRVLEIEADSCGLYIQLRSRRLEKKLYFGGSKKRRRQIRDEFGVNPNSNSNSNSTPNLRDGLNPNSNFRVDSDAAIEAETESRARVSRETTPCNLIREPDIVRTPRSSTRRPSSATQRNRVARNPTVQQISASQEMDELFATAEKEQRKEFIKKYNYDPVKDKPLPGRYEWVKMKP